MIVSILAAATVIASFDCTIEAPQAIGFEGAKITSSAIGLPSATLQFSIRIEDGKPKYAVVDWPNDPMRVAGRFPAITTAPSSYAFSAFSPGPCLFTEQACLTQFNLVETSTGTANLIVSPVALAFDDKTQARSPFAVLARGRCVRLRTKK